MYSIMRSTMGTILAGLVIGLFLGGSSPTYLPSPAVYFAQVIETNPKPPIEQNPTPPTAESPKPLIEQNPSPPTVENPKPFIEQNPKPPMEKPSM